MDHRHNVLRVALVSLVVVAIAITGSGVALAAQDTEQDTGSMLDTVEQFLQQVDDFLETVADLLQTVRAIGGGGGGD